MRYPFRALVVGNTVLVTRDGVPVGSYVVKALRSFRKELTQATAGDEVGVLLRGARREDFAGGDVLTIR